LLLICLLAFIPLGAAADSASAGDGAKGSAQESGSDGELSAGFNAALDQQSEPGNLPQPPNWWWKFGELLLALVVIIAMIVVVAHVLRRTVGRGTIGGGDNSGPICLLGSHHFDQRHSVQLIEVGGKVLVVGLAEGSVDLLDKIEDEKTIVELRRLAPEAATLRHFGDHLKSAFSRVRKSEDLERSKEAVQRLKSRLKGKDETKH